MGLEVRQRLDLAGQCMWQFRGYQRDRHYAKKINLNFLSHVGNLTFVRYFFAPACAETGLTVGVLVAFLDRWQHTDGA